MFCRLQNFTWLSISMVGGERRIFYFWMYCSFQDLFVCLFVSWTIPLCALCMCVNMHMLSQSLWCFMSIMNLLSISLCCALSLPASQINPVFFITMTHRYPPSLSPPSDTHFKMLLSVTRPSIPLLPLSGWGGDIWVAFFSSVWKWLFIITINISHHGSCRQELFQSKSLEQLLSMLSCAIFHKLTLTPEWFNLNSNVKTHGSTFIQMFCLLQDLLPPKK